MQSTLFSGLFKRRCEPIAAKQSGEGSYEL